MDTLIPVVVIKELSESGAKSLFDHPYPAMLHRLHERFGIKIQLNLFYEKDDFTLAQRPKRHSPTLFQKRLFCTSKALVLIFKSACFASQKRLFSNPNSASIQKQCF